MISRCLETGSCAGTEYAQSSVGKMGKVEKMAKIICVEDELDIQEDIVEVLTEQGHQVIAASDGLEGFEAIQRHRPDLVVCDFLMPRMNGGQLFEKLKNEYTDFLKLPFVFLSAHADKRHIENGVTMGADDYLTKPVQFERLIETVNELLAES